jgi:hypothetical protein
MPEYSSRSAAFENEATMRFFAATIAAIGFKLNDDRPFTMEFYDSMTSEEQKSFLVVFFIQQWDHLTPQQRMQEIATMPPQCHECGQEKPSMAPDACIGYTRLYCSDCMLRRLLGVRSPPPS